MRQLLNVFIGALVMGGYLLYESIVFGVMLWFAWNMSIVSYFGLPFMTYFQAAGLVFVVKILLFDSSKLNSQPTMVITKETDPKSKSV